MDELDGDTNLGESCEVCGETNFYEESGFYYCRVCNTQSQESRIFVEEQTYVAGFQTRLAVLRDKDDGDLEPAHRFTSWEVYNLILKTLTDKLIDMGYPPILKDKVFQLYAAYLLKRRVILTRNKRSAITQNEPFQNIYALYDRNPAKLPPRGPKRLAKLARQEAVESGVHDPTVSMTIAKRRKTKTRRKAFEQEYLERTSQNVDADTTVDAYSLDIKPAKRAKIVKGGKLQVTDGLSNVSHALKEHLCPRADFSKTYTNKRHQPCINRYLSTLLAAEQFNMRSVMVLLFVSLRQIGCKVLFSDINRMFSDGTLWVGNIGALLEDEDLRKINLSCNNFLTGFMGSFNILSAAKAIDMFLIYMGIKDFPYPKFNDFFPKFIEDLVLPSEVKSLVRQVNKVYHLQEQSESMGRNYVYYSFLPELHIVPIIVVVLKMLFGLDDTTERYQSQFAKLVNQVIDEKELDYEDSEWSKLFVLEDWFSFIRYRDTVINHEVECVTSCDPNHLPNVRNVQSSINKFGGHAASVTKSTTRLVNACDEVKSIFQQVCKHLNNDKEIPELPQYKTPRLPKQDVINTFVDNYPNVALKDVKMDKLQQDFSKRRIDFVYNPDKYISLLNAAGYKVKLIQADAIQYKKKLKFRRKKLLLFQPYKKYNHKIGSHLNGTMSETMQFLLSLSTSVVGGKEIDTRILRHHIEAFGELFCEISSACNYEPH